MACTLVKLILAGIYLMKGLDAAMKYGICVGIKDAFEALDQVGYDYIELPLALIAALSDAEFDELVARLTMSNIKCEACNVLLPGTIKLTGDNVDMQHIKTYIEGAMARAAKIGAQVVVMGSSGSRNVPLGTSIEKGYAQLAEALNLIGAIAAKHGIDIAIEPLNDNESNIVTTYMSGLYLAALANQPNVGTLVDAYHFCLVNEPLSNLYAKKPMHVHYADKLGRRIPQVSNPTGIAFFDALKVSGYDGRVSLEGAMAPGCDWLESATEAFKALKAMCES